MMNVNKKLVGVLTAAALVMGLAGAPALAQESKPEKTKETQPAKKDEHKDHDKDHKDHKHDQDKSKDKGEKKADKGDKKSEKKMVSPGETAPDFKLKDTEGKDVSLAALTKEGKTVVLQWFNPDCPFVVMHYEKGAKTFIDLASKYKDKNVVVLGINSGAKGKQGAGLERNQKAVKDWKINYPILMDESGTVGKAYNAKNTPLTVIIGKDGKIAYYGAIDDADGASGPGKNNYAVKALDEILGGKSVTTASTKPYGCNVKYAD